MTNSSVSTKRRICNKCKKPIKNRELEEHIDYHTPYWTGKKITLSGADQIRLMIKGNGSWKPIIKKQEELYKNHKNQLDFVKILQLKQFEKDNNIRFKVCGDTILFEVLNNV